MKILSDPQEAAEVLLQAFEKILQENMKDVPILNHRLQVQTLGFQEYEGRIIGIVITPWLMNLVMLPNEQDDWSMLNLGKKMPIKFPSINYKFMVNEIDDIGKYKTHSLYSPMHEFSSQDHAVKVAQDFLGGLLVKREPTAEELVDEDLLGRIMRGEEVKVNLDEFATIEPIKPAEKVSKVSMTTEQQPKQMTRRALLSKVLPRG